MSWFKKSATKEQTREACVAMLIQEYGCTHYTEWTFMVFGNSYWPDHISNKKKYLQLLKKHNLKDSSL